MSDFKHKNNFLARWLEGEVSEEERKRFEASKDYLAFKDILNATERFERPVFDVESNLTAQKEFNKTYNAKKPKVVQLKLFLSAAAAVVLILIGLRIFIPQSTTIRTEVSQIKTLTLPDNSQVTLNAGSSIEYVPKDFLTKRKLTLKGQAFFKVAKGSTFIVKTKNGDISVLGTQFDVNAREYRLEVHCFEGRVQVDNDKESVIIEGGKAVRSGRSKKMLQFEIQDQEPTWLNGISTFKEVPLKQVINELERQFGITIQSGDIDTERMFTGFFENKDLNSAIKTCFEPMNINCIFINSKKIKLVNK
ncbi:FecR family protein [Aquimarina algicola]|uniref:DUF4974 domain-containing protein n=1 Tax=Aquimarina algicola TaxID=2589995 RepID=A0A504JE85_9FLAO|nr:FecR domain-containing protein [Aquimarina algicola]TPN86962.1 DUF4974 domain-containing protein [Aquimarina algicola]